MPYDPAADKALQGALSRLHDPTDPLAQWVAGRACVQQLQIAAARLLLELLDAGHSQTEIAAAAGVSQQAISRAENRAEALLSGIRAHRRYVERRGS